MLNTFWRLPQNFLNNLKKNFPFEFKCIRFNFKNSTIFCISYNVIFLTKLLQQRKYRSNFSVFSAKAKTFPQCGKIFGALFMTLVIYLYCCYIYYREQLYLSLSFIKKKITYSPIIISVTFAGVTQKYFLSLIIITSLTTNYHFTMRIIIKEEFIVRL